MIDFRTFFRQRIARSFVLLFAIMLLITNLTVYIVATAEYERQTQRQEDSFVEMLKHMLLWEDESTLVAFAEHYGHTHGVDFLITDPHGGVLYETPTLPEGAEPIPILDDEGDILGYVTIGYLQADYGTDVLIGLTIVNGVSLLLFVASMFLLRRHLDAQYDRLREDLDRIGQDGVPFRFSDVEAISRRYAAAIRAKVEMKDLQEQYVRMLAHDLKTPLTVIRAYLEGVANGRLTFDRDMNAALLEEVSVMEATIPRFIFSAPGQVPTRQNIAPFIRNRLSNLEDVFETKRMKLVSKLEDLTIEVAAEDVIRILDHLVFNAFYYTEPGGTVTVTLEAGSRCLSVRDTGIGMSAETIRKIHAGSYRAENAVRHNLNGSGLGLQIVFETASRIHASVAIESDEGRGTNVAVVFDQRGSTMSEENRND
jgi:signal transduction histidine kinase